MSIERSPILVAITGASGSRYALTLIERLLMLDQHVTLMVTRAGEMVLRHESDLFGSPFEQDKTGQVPGNQNAHQGAPHSVERMPDDAIGCMGEGGMVEGAGDFQRMRHDLLTHFKAKVGKGREGRLQIVHRDDWSSFPASGSGGRRVLVIVPCSMGTLASVAMGLSDNLIERAADVAIKERWPLILVPREMPFSTIHLENMLKLSRMGAVIMPAAPGLYNRPDSVQEMIDFVVVRILDALKIKHPWGRPWGESPP